MSADYAVYRRLGCGCKYEEVGKRWSWKCPGHQTTDAPIPPTKLPAPKIRPYQAPRRTA